MDNYHPKRALFELNLQFKFVIVIDQFRARSNNVPMKFKICVELIDPDPIK